MDPTESVNKDEIVCKIVGQLFLDSRLAVEKLTRQVEFLQRELAQAHTERDDALRLVGRGTP